MSFFDEFADMVNQEVTWEQATGAYSDDRGTRAYSDPVAISARVVRRAVEIQDPRGNRIVDGADVWADPENVISAGDRITLADGLVTTVLPGSRRPTDEAGEVSHQRLVVGAIGSGRNL